MSQIKICGLSRIEDIDYVNEARPDYAGFIIHFPKSHRNVTVEQLRKLKQRLAPEIPAVGVFVNQPVELVAGIAEAGLIDMIQLHGEEDESYLKRLRIYTGKPLIQAHVVQSEADVRKAEESSAEYLLFDAGKGEGRAFDWKILNSVTRPYFLAGGLDAENIETAMEHLNPFALDVSSGAESEKRKSREKILEIVDKTRRFAKGGNRDE